MNVKVMLTVQEVEFTGSPVFFSATIVVPSHRLLTDDVYRVFQEMYAEYLAQNGALGKEGTE